MQRIDHSEEIKPEYMVTASVEEVVLGYLRTNVEVGTVSRSYVFQNALNYILTVNLFFFSLCSSELGMLTLGQLSL